MRVKLALRQRRDSPTAFSIEMRGDKRVYLIEEDIERHRVGIRRVTGGCWCVGLDANLSRHSRQLEKPAFPRLRAVTQGQPAHGARLPVSRREQSIRHR